MKLYLGVCNNYNIISQKVIKKICVLNNLNSYVLPVGSDYLAGGTFLPVLPEGQQSCWRDMPIESVVTVLFRELRFSKGLGRPPVVHALKTLDSNK